MSRRYVRLKGMQPNQLILASRNDTGDIGCIADALQALNRGRQCCLRAQQLAEQCGAEGTLRLGVPLTPRQVAV